MSARKLLFAFNVPRAECGCRREVSFLRQVETALRNPLGTKSCQPPRLRGWSALLCAGWLVTSASSLAATNTMVSTRLTGTWQLSSPRVSCNVQLKITTDGTAALQAGTQVTRWKFETQATEESNDWKIVSQPVSSSGTPECTFPKYVQPGFGRETYVRFLAEDRKMTLCTTDNIGGCNQWFERVGSPAATPAATTSTLVERAVYRAVPEQSELFELVPKDAMPVLIPDLSGQQFKQMRCLAMFAWDVGGTYKQPFGELRIASCPDRDAFAKIGRDIAGAEFVRSLSNATITPDERLRFGASYLAEKTPDGARLYAFPVGLEVGIQLNTVIWLPAGGKRAVVVQLVGMAECEGQKPYVETPFCKDRWAALRKIAVEVARFPLAGSQ